MSGDAFVDTNVWLYALVLEPGEDAKHDCAKHLIAGLGSSTVSPQVMAQLDNELSPP
jgi:predicted nucleic acid-binding protein